MTLDASPPTPARPAGAATAAVADSGSGARSALAALDVAIEAGRALGLDTEPAEGIRREAGERLANPDAVYVLALVGGTGVGKSTLLNAIAGREVSRAGARRPTTDHAVAWVARDAQADATPLLDRLGVADRRLHDEAPYRGVVLLDLPDVDSLAAGNRELVEELLPRIDAVGWVTDPEKYADALLHDEFLRAWLPRLGRQVVVLNKRDRLEQQGLGRVRDDLEQRVANLRPGGPVPVVATAGTAGAEGIAELDAWLREAVDAKRVIVERIRLAAAQAVDALADQAGVHTDGAPKPLVDPRARRATIDEVTRELLRLLDLDGARRHAVAATRARARRRGTGPLGLVTTAIRRAAGRDGAAADPGMHLRRWRERGPLERATEPVRVRVADAVAAVPVAIRPAVAAAADPQALRGPLATAMDGALPPVGELEPPSSRLWPVLGLLQTVNLVAAIAAVVWVVAWFIFRPPVDSLDLPVVGPVPVPLLLLGATLVAGYVLARALGWHAGWRGRRWAAAVATDVRAAVASAVEREAFAGLDRIEAERRRLWGAARGDAAGEPRRR